MQKSIIVLALVLVAAHAAPPVFPNLHILKTTLPISATTTLEPEEDIQAITQTRTQAPLDVTAAKKLLNEAELLQNKNAKYQFATDVEDHISDLTQQREEVRDGLAVKGMYSYSDGYVKRTVHYVADDKGYRVVRMEATPLDGPHVDLTGTASVNTNAHGRQINYRVQSVPIPGPVAKVVDSDTRLREISQ